MFVLVFIVFVLVFASVYPHLVLEIAPEVPLECADCANQQ